MDARSDEIQHAATQCPGQYVSIISTEYSTTCLVIGAALSQLHLMAKLGCHRADHHFSFVPGNQNSTGQITWLSPTSTCTARSRIQPPKGATSASNLARACSTQPKTKKTTTQKNTKKNKNKQTKKTTKTPLPE